MKTEAPQTASPREGFFRRLLRVCRDTAIVLVALLVLAVMLPYWIYIGTAISAHRGKPNAQYKLSDEAFITELKRSFALVPQIIFLPKPDAETSLKWALKAAEGGHIIAQYTLALRYKNGINGEPANYREALNWYLRAEALYPTVSESEEYQDFDKLIKLSKAAGSARKEMTRAYLSGDFKKAGLVLEEKDLIEAAKWYEKAAKKGHEDVQAKLVALQNPAAAPENEQSQSAENKTAADLWSLFMQSLFQ